MKSNFMKMDRLLLFLTIVMFVFGLFMIFSASSVRASLSGEPYHYFIRQGIILVICSIVSVFIVSMPLKFFAKMSFVIALFIIGSLVVVYLYGIVSHSARSWINLGFYNYQPSEFAKTAIILYMAAYYNKYRESKRLIVITIPLIVAAIICGLTFIQPDFGTTFILLVITASIFFTIPFEKGMKKTISQYLGLIAAVFILFFFFTDSSILKPGQLSRLDFRNPCAKYLSGGSGYQVCNGFIAINNGGLWGEGIGNSTQKYLYLPEAHTDFIFAVVVEELGLIVGLIILLIYLLMLFLIIRIAMRSRNVLGSVIAYGTAVYMFLHIFINLGGVLGLLPLTGVPLPFLSYGGSYALNLAILLALVQSVEIQNKKDIQKIMLQGGKVSS